MEQFVNAEMKSFSTKVKLYLMQKIAELYYLPTWHCKDLFFSEEIFFNQSQAVLDAKDCRIILPTWDCKAFEQKLSSPPASAMVHNLSVAYIMKCDDDTFVRPDVVLKEILNIARKKHLHMGNLNLLHMPLRTGKWTVAFVEWPRKIYPSYVNGHGYIISSDIVRQIILFKIEDMSRGMWVEDFNIISTIQYSHNWKFYQYGCTEIYYIAHYQSPRKMICLWDKLVRGLPSAATSDD